MEEAGVDDDWDEMEAKENVTINVKFEDDTADDWEMGPGNKKKYYKRKTQPCVCGLKICSNLSRLFSEKLLVMPVRRTVNNSMREWLDQNTTLSEKSDEAIRLSCQSIALPVRGQICVTSKTK